MIRDKLHSDGFAEVTEVKSGIFIEIVHTSPDTEQAKKDADGMTQKLFLNPIYQELISTETVDITPPIAEK